MSQTKPRVAIIVLNYNGKQYVKRCLDSIFHNNYPNFEVIFVDNDSPDKSADVAESLFSSERRFTLIRNKENFGFSVGNNIGFKRAKSEYVIALNNDTEVQNNFVETLVRIAESDKTIGSVGCKIIQLDGRVLYGPKYMNYGFITRVCHIEAYDKATVNLANCGCATLFRKSMIDKIGGFDPNLWTDWEDHDLGYRVNIAGFKCVYTPLTKVLHLGGGIYLGLNDEREIRIIRNQLLTYVKNYEHRSLIPRLPLALAIIFMRKLIHGKQRQFFLGLANFFRMFSTVIQERKKVQKLRVVSDERIFSSCRVPEKQSLLKSLRIL